jgi:uncharacterized protein YecE (DUF72 family)
MPDEQLSFNFAGAKPIAGSAAPLLPRAQQLHERAARLAERNVFLGTSSWKYPAWLGQIYQPARYRPRGRFSAPRFNDECLSEYARVFPTVCGDYVFYQFPTPQMWEQTFDQLPDGFRFGLKVPEEVTCERFPRLPRYGDRAGMLNGHFMDAALTTDQLLTPLEPYRDRLGPLMFEFGTIHDDPLREPGRFTDALDHFLMRLPVERFQFAVEVRNPEFLNHDGYFECLRAHRVAHCLNSWTRMPPIQEQLQRPGVATAQHTVARFLLRPGRSYAEAVEQFAPYERVEDPYPEGRAALGDLMKQSMAAGRSLYAYVNNRFEGNAIETIETTLNESGL